MAALRHRGSDKKKIFIGQIGVNKNKKLRYRGSIKKQKLRLEAHVRSLLSAMQMQWKPSICSA